MEKINKKPKIIHLSKDEKIELTIQGARKNLDLKNYIEWFLDKLANNKVEILKTKIMIKEQIYLAQMDYGYGKSDKNWLPCTKDDEFIYFKRNKDGVHAWHCNKVALNDHKLLDLKSQM